MLLSIIDNKDLLLFFVVISLVVISLAMVYLAYSQNQTFKKHLKENNTDNEMHELQLLSKELENIPKSTNSELTAYEDEQEKKAIISYDELIQNRNNVSIGYENKELIDDIEIKKVDLSKTGELELDKIKQRDNSKVTLVTYEHEEEFLASLKKLQYLLTK